LLSHKYSADMQQGTKINMCHMLQTKNMREDLSLILIYWSFNNFPKSRSTFYKVSPRPFLIKWSHFPALPCSSKQKEI